MLEGYVFDRSSWIFASYESFLRVMDSMITNTSNGCVSKTHTTWRKNYPAWTLDCNFNGLPTRPIMVRPLKIRVSWLTSGRKPPEYIREYSARIPACIAVDGSPREKMWSTWSFLLNTTSPLTQHEAEELVREGYKVIDWASTASADEEPDLLEWAVQSQT